MMNDEITNYLNSLYLDEFSNVGVEFHHTYFILMTLQKMKSKNLEKRLKVNL